MNLLKLLFSRYFYSKEIANQINKELDQIAALHAESQNDYFEFKSFFGREIKLQSRIKTEFAVVYINPEFIKELL